MAKMAGAELRDLIRKRRDASAKFISDNHSADRKEALSFYRGENSTVYGDSGDGLSTVVSRDTYEAIESILPGLIKPFVAGDEAVSFDPRGPEDEEGSKQATEYINYRFANDNSAFRVVYDFAKDGLMYRLGVAKVVHEEVEESIVETYELEDEIAFAAMEAQIAEDKALEMLDDPLQDDATGVITVQVKRSETRPTYRVHIVAPEEFLHEDKLASLTDATFLAHKKAVAVGDLIAMGLDKKKCLKLQGLDNDSDETEQRHDQADDEHFDDDDLARKVTVTDAYVRCDYNDDGTLQWRRVVLGGSEDTILHDEPVEDHPFVVWTPIPIPHRLIGLSIHDATRDIQMQATAVSRELLNASYLANRPQREVVEGQVNLEDLQSPAVGGVVRVKAPGMVREIPSGGDKVMQQCMAILEHLATIREQRTGSTRYNQGMDANSLNKTATGISIIQNASTQRLEVIARQLAEAMQEIFRKMLELVSLHADRKEVIRLRGEWVEMDPREWKNGYDTTVSVGLGTGNKEQMAAHLTNLMNIQKEIGAAQGGLDGPIVKWDNIYEAAKRLTENLGLKGVERYFNDPTADAPEASPEAQQPPQDPNSDPTVIKAKMDNDARLEQARIEAASREEVAKINAEKEIYIAGLAVPPALDAASTMEPAPMGPPSAEIPLEAMMPPDPIMQGAAFGEDLPPEMTE